MSRDYTAPTAGNPLYDRFEELFGAAAIGKLYRLPYHMHDGVLAYLIRGEPQGDFLERIFDNDFAHAYRCADTMNLRAMHAYADFLIDVMPISPIPAWGSSAKRIKWQETGGMEGLLKLMHSSAANQQKGIEE